VGLCPSWRKADLSQNGAQVGPPLAGGQVGPPQAKGQVGPSQTGALADLS